MKYYVEPRSREWFALRLGRITSTRLKVIAHGTLAAQTKLLDELQWEIDSPEEAIDKAMEGFGYATPASIKLGREGEDKLIARYELRYQIETGKKLKLDRPGFVTHDALPEFGCSPDWLTPDRVGEGKTRVDHAKHEFAIKHGLLLEDKDQVYCHMMCCRKSKAHYISFCPDYPDDAANLCIVDVEEDKFYSNQLYSELNRFVKHLRAGTRPTVPQFQCGVPNFFD